MSEKKSAKAEKKVVQKLVQMLRGDKTADVHPDEVVNYEKAGWVKK